MFFRRGVIIVITLTRVWAHVAVSQFRREGRELVIEILWQTGRDHPHVTIAGVKHSNSPSPNV